MSRNPKEEEEFWWNVLAQRAERLHKLVKLKAPCYVIARDLILSTKALAALNPEAFGQAYAESWQKAARIGLSRCPHCGDRLNLDTLAEPWCQECEKEAKEDD